MARSRSRSRTAHGFGIAILPVFLMITGCASVQQAVIGGLVPADIPVASSLDAAPSSSSSSRPAIETVPLSLTPSHGSKTRFIVRAEQSHLTLVVGDLFGHYQAHIRQYRGQMILAKDAPPRVSFTFDMKSVEADLGIVTAVLQYEFLEVDQFPTARLDATITPASNSDANSDLRDVIVDGALLLHGQRRHISFKGTLSRDASGGYRFMSTFDLNRHPFGIRRHDTFDWAANEDFRVSVDFRSTPEHVTAEAAE